MLIGLTGLAGSGKSVIANVLAAEFGFERVRFSAALKNMARSMLRDMGFCEDDVERFIEGDLKESIIPGLGVTSRHVMLTLGTEWGRDMVHPNIWVQIWASRAEGFARVVTEDVRFPNEVEALRARGGVIWHVERPGHALATTSGHVSEQLAVTPDLTLVNDRSLEGLEAAVRGLVRRSCGGAA
jgi:hypothetical protein